MPEFSVVTTTRVPDEVRGHWREFAARGHLRRLWRLPAQPGESRTFALFESAGEGQLDSLLSAVPQRLRCTEEVTALGAHPCDPVASGVVGRPGRGPESLIAMTVTVPSGTPSSTVEEAGAREAVRLRDLAERGHLVRLWTLPQSPDGPRTLGVWRARDPGELMAIVESLPLSGWMTIETTPLTPHPDDPIRMR